MASRRDAQRARHTHSEGAGSQLPSRMCWVPRRWSFEFRFHQRDPPRWFIPGNLVGLTPNAAGSGNYKQNMISVVFHKGRFLKRTAKERLVVYSVARAIISRKAIWQENLC